MFKEYHAGGTTLIVIIALIILVGIGYYLVSEGIVDLSQFGLDFSQIDDYKDAAKELKDAAGDFINETDNLDREELAQRVVEKVVEE